MAAMGQKAKGDGIPDWLSALAKEVDAISRERQDSEREARMKKKNLPAKLSPAKALVPQDDEAKIVDFVTPIWREAQDMHAARHNRDDLIASLEAYIQRGVDETQ